MAQKGYIKNSTTADLGAPELAAIFKSILPANGIVDLFDNLACARINDNLVRISPGVYNLSGYLLGVAQGTTADLAVDSGTVGYNRIDLLVAEYVRNGGGAGVDTLQFRIVKGTSTTGTPADPTLTQDDINNESNTTRQEALYRLTITGTTLATPVLMASVQYRDEESMTIALSDETTALTTGTAKVTIRAPFAMTLTKIPRASVNTVSSSGLVTVDINEGGASILSTKLSIDATEKTSTTAATAAVLSDTAIADDAEITFDIDAAGTGAKGLKVTLFYKRA